MTEIILAALVNLDVFAAAVSLGALKVKVPLYSSAAVSAVGAAFLSASLCFAALIGGVIPDTLMKLIGASVLLFLAVKSLFFDNSGDTADKDLSGSLSLREALILGAGLSADSAATGIGFPEVCAPLAGVLALVFGIAAMYAGVRMGSFFRKKGKGIGFVGALIMLILAVVKLM